MTIRCILVWAGEKSYPVEGFWAEVTHVTLLTTSLWDFNVPLEIKPGAKCTQLANYIFTTEDAKKLKFRVEVLTESNKKKLLEINNVPFPSFQPKEVYYIIITNTRNSKNASRMHLSVSFKNITSIYNAALARGQIVLKEERSLFLAHFSDKMKRLAKDEKDPLRKAVLLTQAIYGNFEDTRNNGRIKNLLAYVDKKRGDSLDNPHAAKKPSITRQSPLGQRHPAILKSVV